MRNFIYAKSVATSGLVSAGAAGAFGLAYLNADGKMAFDDGSHVKDKGYFVLCRPADKGGNVVLPFYKNRYRHTRSVYQAATKFVAEIVVPASVLPGVDYTILLVKKGLKFNERNRWHVTARAKAGVDGAVVAQSLVAQVNAMTDTLGLVATFIPGNASDSKIKFEAVDACIGKDYGILGADELIDAVVTVSSKGLSARNDSAAIVDLADKCASEVGFEYTYQDDVRYLYPDYPMSVTSHTELTDPGFTVYTIWFAEPREVKTVDEVVNQIVQVAFNASSHSAFESVLAALEA